jgi:hypothetical protein
MAHALAALIALFVLAAASVLLAHGEPSRHAEDVEIGQEMMRLFKTTRRDVPER